MLQAAHKPELLSNNFTHLEYNPRPGRTLIGRKILYRDVYMTGWAYKMCSPEDLRTPVVTGEGKRVSSPYILNSVINNMLTFMNLYNCYD